MPSYADVTLCSPLWHIYFILILNYLHILLKHSYTIFYKLREKLQQYLINILPGLKVSSLPNKWSRRRPRQKCSIIWNISVGFSVLPRGGYKSVTDQLNRHEYLLYFVVRENILAPPPTESNGYSEGEEKLSFTLYSAKRLFSEIFFPGGIQPSWKITQILADGGIWQALRWVRGLYQKWPLWGVGVWIFSRTKHYYTLP